MDNRVENFCQFASASDVGCVRELNEDSLFCGEGLWVVADGMGGHACGEVASKIAVDTVSELYVDSPSLEEPIIEAHKTIVEEAANGEGQSGMGTTIVALATSHANYQVAWVGDSRAYLWDIRKKQLSQISEDHSLIVRLIKSGLIKPEDARNHPQRHMITQCLGSTEIQQPKVDVVSGEWEFKQQILLCSDGLTDEVRDDEISKILSKDISTDKKVSLLVETAKNNGGADNISVILVESPISKDKSLWQKITDLFK